MGRLRLPTPVRGSRDLSDIDAGIDADIDAGAGNGPDHDPGAGVERAAAESGSGSEPVRTGEPGEPGEPSGVQLRPGRPARRLTVALSVPPAPTALTARTAPAAGPQPRTTFGQPLIDQLAESARRRPDPQPLPAPVPPLAPVPAAAPVQAAPVQAAEPVDQDLAAPVQADGPATGRRPSRATVVLTGSVLGLLVGGVGLGGAYHVYKGPQYSATISILITGSAGSLLDPSVETTPQQRDVTTRVDLLGSALVESRAEQRAGAELPPLKLTSRSDSDVITAEVTAPDREAAATAVNAFVSSYETLLAAQQRETLTGEQTRLETLNAGYRKQVATLDREIERAGEVRRQLLLTAQAPRRQTLADSMDDVATRLSRVEETLGRLPATTQRLDRSAVTRPAGTSLPVDLLSGAALGVLAAGLVLLRRFRPRLG